jgi:SagB-type dehydrogenase family enzyme
MDIKDSIHYHECTKHTYESVRDTDFSLDWKIYPLKYKNYNKNLRKISLPKFDLRNSGISTLEAISGLKTLNNNITNLKDLSEFLYFTYGKTGLKRYPNMLFEMRAAPSAGALYPVELYFIARSLKFLEDGVYHFDPGESLLTQLRSGDFSKYIDNESELCFILTTIFWRAAWKYRSRSYRYCYMDSGHVIGNIIPISHTFGKKPKISYYFDDRAINKLIGIDGVKESTAACLIIENSNNALLSKNIISINDNSNMISSIKTPYDPLSNSEIDYPIIQKINEMTFSLGNYPKNIETLIEHRKKKVVKFHDQKNQIVLPKPDSMKSKELFRSIKERRSVREFNQNPISLLDFSNILYYSTSSVNSEFSNADGEKQSFFDFYIIINNVKDIPKGIYKYSHEENSLVVIKLGDFRFDATFISMEQEVVGNSCFAVLLIADFDEIKILGDRAYRIIHIESGIIGQNIYLAATALGHGCTGIGAFYDDKIDEFLELSGTNQKVIYELTVGSAKPDDRLVP